MPYEELNKESLLWMYETMVTIRRFEEQSRREADAGKLRGMHSSIGQEAVQTGICAHLNEKDYVLGTHRSHHHCIAKGLDINEMMAELLGKSTGTCKVKGGTMHIADIDKGMLGANGVVGSNIPVATGVALTAKVKGTDQVSVVFFGDGAIDEGVFWESLNFACLKNISLLFVCEDNNLAIHSKSSERHGYRSITDIIDRFDCHVIQSESTDPEVIADLTTHGITHSLEKGGPVFFHFKCYRYLEHVGINEDFQFGYRSRDELKRWQAIDPIFIQRKKLLSNGHH